MVYTTYLKMGIMLIGLLATFSFLIPALKNNDQLKKNRAGILFMGTCFLVLLVSVLEFVLNYKF